MSIDTTHGARRRPVVAKRILMSATLLMIVGLLVATTPGAVYGQGGHGDGMQYGHSSYFDPDKIVTLSGELTLVTGDWELWGHGNHTGGGMGFDLLLDNGDKVELMLGPVWFLEENGIVPSIGERVTVTGSRVDAYDDGRHHGGGNGGHGGMMGGDDGDDDYVIAIILEADGVTLALRDDEGYPLWRGGEDWSGHTWFDPDTITTSTGTLDETLGMWSSWGHGNHTGNGMHYTFDADTGESFYAMLGPSWYLEREGIKLESGARVQLRGSIVDAYWSRYDDRRFLVATDITVDGKTVQLRDEWGYPLWHGTGWFYYSPEWSSNRVAEVAGVVKQVRRKRNGRYLDKGYEVVVKAGGRNYTLYVGPDWDVKRIGMRLRRGEAISVRGALGTAGSRREMVVQYLESATKRWRFRGSDGVPVWVRGAR